MNDNYSYEFIAILKICLFNAIDKKRIENGCTKALLRICFNKSSNTHVSFFTAKNAI